MKITTLVVFGSLSSLLFGCAPYTKPDVLVEAPLHRADQVTANIINVGDGSCQIVECADGRSPILVDCGTSLFAAGAGKAKVLAQVEDILARHDHRLRLVVSQSGAEHISLLDEVLEGAQVESIHFAGKRRLLPDVVLEHEAIPLPLSQPWEGWSFDSSQPFEPLACGSGNTYVLSANAAYRYAPEDQKRHSLTLLIEHGDQSLLLASDATGHTQDKIIQSLDTIKSPIKVSALVAPDHGSTQLHANDAAWGERIEPAVVVYTAGRLNGQPSCAAAVSYTQLLPAAGHPFECATTGEGLFRLMQKSPNSNSDNSEHRAAHSDRAEYTTELSGTLRVTLNQSSLAVSCQYQADCGI